MKKRGGKAEPFRNNSPPKWRRNSPVSQSGFSAERHYSYQSWPRYALEPSRINLSSRFDRRSIQYSALQEWLIRINTIHFRILCAAFIYGTNRNKMFLFLEISVRNSKAHFNISLILIILLYFSFQ